MKVIIRSVISDIVGKDRKETSKEIEDLEKEINDMHELKIKASEITEVERRDEVVQLSEMAINSMEDDLKILRIKQSQNTQFRAKAKWYEYGEKSNKYFLNLNKVYKKQKLIDTIKCNGTTYRGQEEVTKGITDFYRNLYRYEEVEEEEDDFYANCPTLSQNSKEFMDKELTEEDLLTALKTCADSAPGSDGIPYSVYKKLWSITGPYIMKAWSYSCAIGS